MATNHITLECGDCDGFILVCALQQSRRTAMVAEWCADHGPRMMVVPRKSPDSEVWWWSVLGFRADPFEVVATWRSEPERL